MLSEKKCVPCQGGVPPLSNDEMQPLLAELDGWSVINDHHLEKTFTFPDFVTALDFVNKLGAVAEEEAHHPDIYLAWGKVGVTIWTHKIDGLTESDFVLAAKADKL
ncbi:MAG: 4a-hydroxytetrahydrobiopterin dehydratase [Phycisphaerae bacterium]